LFAPCFLVSYDVDNFSLDLVGSISGSGIDEDITATSDEDSPSEPRFEFDQEVSGIGRLNGVEIFAVGFDDAGNHLSRFQ